MGQKTGIAWTKSTINIWHGCHKVSAGCLNCYAEVSTPVRVKRAHGLEVWGATAARSETKGWAKSLRKWNREQEDAIARHKAAPAVVQHPGEWRVFGQSLSDTFEDRADACVVRPDGSRVTLDVLRAEFFAEVELAKALTFQLLTKRPQNIRRMVPAAWLEHWPEHVQIGTTCEDQRAADERIPHLLKVPAPVRFLSVEPQIGPVDLSWWLDRQDVNDRWPARIAWVICGGESGAGARPFSYEWMESLRDQCAAAGVPFFPKQGPGGEGEECFPVELRGIRAFPTRRSA